VECTISTSRTIYLFSYLGTSRTYGILKRLRQRQLQLELDHDISIG
jgi:hypothetical protein